MNKKPNIVATSISTEEEKAFDFLMMHFNRVVTMDEVNNKAIKRAGKVGEAIRGLLGAVHLYSRVRSGAKVMVVNETTK